MTSESPAYVAAHIEQALAADPRTTELGVHVVVRDDDVFLRGQIAGDHHRELVLTVATEAAAGRRVHDELSLLDVREPEGEEQLR